MTKYSSSSNAKDMILAESMRLFYDNGYVNTTFDMIAEACSLSKGTLTYHYPNKKYIAFGVRTGYMRELKNIVAEKSYAKYKTYDLRNATAVEMRIMLRFMRDDPKVSRFNHETCLLGLDFISEQTRTFYELHDRKYDLGFDKGIGEGSLIACAANGAIASMILCYNNGELNCAYDEFEDYRVGVSFRLMHTSDEEIAEIIEESRRMTDELNVRYRPYFVFE